MFCFCSRMAADNDNRPLREASRLLTIAGRVERDGHVTFACPDERLSGESSDAEPGFPNDPREA